MATIVQRIIFKNTTTEKLYKLYMDAKLHALISGGSVKISEKIGSKVEVFGGYIKGKTLQVVKNKLIVQSWRASDWSSKDSDSALILSFDRKGKDAILNVTHANVPDNQAEGLNKGWHDHYWNPWKQYLAGKAITRPED